MGFSRFFRKSQPFQHIGLWNFDNVNIFKINKCKKKCFREDHEILSLGLILADLKYDEARFSKFWFLRGLPIWSSVKNRPIFNRRHAAGKLLVVNICLFIEIHNIVTSNTSTMSNLLWKITDGQSSQLFKSYWPMNITAELISRVTAQRDELSNKTTT